MITVSARSIPFPGEATLREETSDPEGVRYPNTWGIASTKIMVTTTTFLEPWYIPLSSSSVRSRLMIFAPVNSCMMIDPVEVDVGQEEVQEEDHDGPEHLRPEVDVALRLGHGRHPRRDRLEAVQARLRPVVGEAQEQQRADGRQGEAGHREGDVGGMGPEVVHAEEQPEDDDDRDRPGVVPGDLLFRHRDSERAGGPTIYSSPRRRAAR